MPYKGPDRRSGGSGMQCDECLTNVKDIAMLKANYDSILYEVRTQTTALKETNENLALVINQLAENKGARKIAVLIASIVGSCTGFLAEIGIDKFLHISPR